MNPDKQRITIAEACGWHNICHYDYSGRGFGNWPASIVAKVKAADEKASGWQGYRPGTKERYDALWEARRKMPTNVAYVVSDNEPQREALPDFLEDLNAMHEAEKVLSKEEDSTIRARNQFNLYVWFLYEVCTGHAWESDTNDYPGDVMCATAAQRAKAFLKTIGKWIDEPCTPTS